MSLHTGAPPFSCSNSRFRRRRFFHLLILHTRHLRSKALLDTRTTNPSIDRSWTGSDAFRDLLDRDTGITTQYDTNHAATELLQIRTRRMASFQASKISQTRSTVFLTHPAAVPAAVPDGVTVGQ